jgi:Na+/H+ antiporter NhaA
MSTDTAFALGMLALVGPRFPDRLRAYLLTFSVVDDLVALGIITFAYSGPIAVGALLAGLAILLVVYVFRRAGFRNGLGYGLLGVAASTRSWPASRWA